MKRTAHDRNLDFEVVALARHSAVRVGRTIPTLARRGEIDDVTVRNFFDQFAEEFGGKGWWR